MLFNKPKTVIVVGCGRLGASLAGALSSKGYHVVIIGKSSDSFRKLPEGFSGYEVEGDATNADLLEKAGINNTDIVIVVTENDNTNSLIAQIACRIYNVERVFMRLNDYEKESLIDGFNIEIISPYKLCLHEFEKLSAIKLEEVAAV